MHNMHTHIHTYKHTYIHTQFTDLSITSSDCSMRLYRQTNIHTHTHTCIHSSQISYNIIWMQHAPIHTYIHTYTHSSRISRSHHLAAVCVYTYIQTHIHTYIHTHIHTNIHTYTVHGSLNHIIRLLHASILCVTYAKRTFRVFLCDSRAPGGSSDIRVPG